MRYRRTAHSSIKLIIDQILNSYLNNRNKEERERAATAVDPQAFLSLRYHELWRKCCAERVRNRREREIAARIELERLLARREFQGNFGRRRRMQLRRRFELVREAMRFEEHQHETRKWKRICRLIYGDIETANSAKIGGYVGLLIIRKLAVCKEEKEESCKETWNCAAA